MPAHLSIREVSKVYGGQTAVDCVSLEVEQGEFVALLGPSGCGKTTLLRTIAGLVMPTSGDISIDGKSILEIPAHKRGIGMVFQSYALFPHMTVSDNVAFGPRMARLPSRNIPELIRESLRLVRLESLGSRYPHQLSGGQQQRVAIARAIATKPKVLLLDEPLAALDAKLREVMRVELTELQRRLGLTTVFVTHDQQEALAMADRVAVLRDGHLEQYDPPRRMYDRPASAFVADFVGQMNHFPGRVLAIDGQTVHIGTDAADCRILAQRRDGIADGDSVTAMVRPERMVIGSTAPDNAANRVRGVVSTTLFSGETTHCIVETQLGKLVVAERSQDRTADDFPHKPGSEITIAWRVEDTHMFPRT